MHALAAFQPSFLRRKVARAIATGLRIQLLNERSAVHRTRDPETYNAFLRGRYLWNQRTPDGLKGAVRHFEDAIAREPDFAAAHAGMADCYCFLRVYANESLEDMLEKAEMAVARALELDPSLSEAHSSYGLTRILRLDLPGADAAFQRALELNEGEHRARHWRAMTLASRGRYNEALPEIERALELDPFGPSVNQDTGRILCGMGRYKDAIRRLRHTLEIAPQAFWAPVYLALASIQTGDYKGALEAVSKDRVLQAFVRARMGYGDDAREILQADGGKSLSLGLQAALHLGLGEETEAVALFKRGVERRQVDAIELHRGMMHLVQDSGLRAELDFLLRDGISGRVHP